MLIDVLADGLRSGLPYSLAFLGVWMTFRLQREFDLTVDNALVLGGVTFGAWVGSGGSALVGMALAAVLGAVVGLTTYTVKHVLGMSLIMASIIVGTGLFTLNLVVLGQPNLNLFGTSSVLQTWQERFSLSPAQASISFSAVVAVAVFALLAIFLRTEFGLVLRASGMSHKAVRSNAAWPELMLLLSVVAGTTLVALSGALIAQEQGFADVNMGLGTLIAAVTAILVGELLVGRSGPTTRGVIAVLVGAVVYRMALGAAFRAGLQPVYFQGITAVIVFVMLALRRGGPRVLLQARALGLRAGRGAPHRQRVVLGNRSSSGRARDRHPIPQRDAT
jgi:putative tryptophan/tyrosine transport system permease protein